MSLTDDGKGVSSQRTKGKLDLAYARRGEARIISGKESEPITPSNQNMNASYQLIFE